MKGNVKFFNNEKRFGFIAGEDGKEYFVHSSGVTEGVSLREDMAVEFDTEQGDRGLKAVNVKADTGDTIKEVKEEDSTDTTVEESTEEAE